MAVDAKALLNSMLASLEDAVKAAHEEGVAEGIQLGRKQMLEEIIAATHARAEQAILALETSSEAQTGQTSRAGGERAKRGAVPKATDRMIGEHPGHTIAQYEAMTAHYDPLITPKSIGNEIRRQKDKKYRRDDKGRWYPIIQKETADNPTKDPSAASSSATNQGEPNGTTLAS